MTLDLVIRGGTVFDGTGRPPVAADVAIAAGRIAAVGGVRVPEVPAIDARGLHVAPGFIDVHSHSDYTLLVDPRAMSSVHQGVTLEVVGNCGFGCFPLADPALAESNIYGVSDAVPITWRTTAEYFARLEAARPAVNVVSLVPNGQVRLSVMGMADRAATPEERGRMRRLIAECLEAGAIGLSTGLEYPAESAAGEDELTELCRDIGRAGGIYATHTRKRDAGAVAAVGEAIRTAANADVQLQISHLAPRRGVADTEECMALVDTARARGDRVAFDMHTRLYGTTYLHTVIPPWAYDGGRGALAARLRDPGTRARMKTHSSIVSGTGDFGRVVLLDNPRYPEYARRTLAEIGAARGQHPLDAAYDLLLGIINDLPSLMVIIHSYTEEQQETVFRHPLCMPASDATALATDGPLAGSVFHGAYTWAAWFWRFMVRERQVLTPHEAIHRLTGLPATIFGLSGRGTLAVGAAADIAIFDPATFGERGTTFAPNQLARGMRHVLVNGVATLCDGVLTGARAGTVLRRRKAGSVF
ncbi:MAG: hypothetical protein EXQ96_10940 [Alphaproteobacteria bacterium]|nr:hypothetical protein [Alphaproteobacteria bacterium]